MSPLLQRLAAIAVVLILLAGVTFLTLRGMGYEVGLGPATPAVTGSPNRPGVPSAGASASADPQTAFAAIEEQVRALRSLPAPEIGPVQVIPRDELADELRAIFDASYPQARRDADNVSLRALGLLEEDQDVVELQLQLLTDQVVGFYDDDRRRMVVVADAGIDAQARITYAHEYTHALQDAAFSVDALEIDAPGEEDRNLAHLSLLEGDASLAMVLWALEHDPAGLGEVVSAPVPDMSGIPEWMVAQLTFPYGPGANFVANLYQNGGFDAVDAAYADPPDTTEQILHPEKYVAAEEPVDVAPVELASALGEGWTDVAPTTLGEALISIWLQHLGVDQDDADSAARGWGGDRASAAANADGEVALTLRIAFDAATQADEFEAAYEEVAASQPFAAAVQRVTDTEVVVVQATDAGVLDSLLDAAS